MPYLAASISVSVGIAATTFLIVNEHPVWGGIVLVAALLASLVALLAGMAAKPVTEDP